MAAEMEAVHLRAALGEAMRLAGEVNRYLDQTAPWTAIKTDRQAAARAVYTALRAIDSLKILFAPFLPHTSEKLHGFFGYTTPLFGTQGVETRSDSLGEHSVLRYHAKRRPGKWEPSQLQPGQVLNQPGAAVQEAGTQDRRRRTGPAGKIGASRICIHRSETATRDVRHLVDCFIATHSSQPAGPGAGAPLPGACRCGKPQSRCSLAAVRADQVADPAQDQAGDAIAPGNPGNRARFPIGGAQRR